MNLYYRLGIKTALRWGMQGFCDIFLIQLKNKNEHEKKYCKTRRA